MSGKATGLLAKCGGRYVAFVTWIVRLLVGVTFIVSGVAKLIDPWGTLFKIEQYLAVWDVDAPRTITLVGAIFLAGSEFLIGLFVSTGCYRRAVSWLATLFMAVMMPLTFYIMVANPVSDCGCFGDFMIISNTATFWKNVALTAAVVWLDCFNGRVRGLFHANVQWFVTALACLYSLVVALIGYNLQPLIDFRPYKVGTELMADGDDGDDVMFVYERDGERAEFAADELPDSTWTFVERVERAGADSDRGGIAIFDGDEEVTDDVLTGDGEQLLLLIAEPRRADISYTYMLNEMYDKITAAGGTMTAILATNERGLEWWRDVSMAQYECYTADDTALKELARGNIALVYLRDGEIVWKRNAWSIMEESVRDGFDRLAYDGPGIFWMLTASLAALLLVVLGLQSVITSRFRGRRQEPLREP